jgi:DUF4097 and DUF4098 domain-containing protein YvlB
MLRKPLPLLVAVALSLAGSAHARGIDVDKVNGSIRIEGNQQAGNLETVNGSIRVEDGGSAEDISTVNGSIRLGDGVNASSLETVNGGAEIGADARISGSVETVNGTIALGRNAEVSGRVENVNGRIALDAAHVGGGVSTVSGDIEIGADSRVEGGLLVDKPSGWFNWKDRKPRIVIGPRAVVDGTLEFRREVELYVSDSARIGTVSGATAQAFTGDHP